VIHRFTAELADDKVFLVPEKGDTDVDLKAAACASAAPASIKGKSHIDVTSCFPRGVVPALSGGPYNCAHFVNLALKGAPPPKTPLEAKSLETVALWNELIASGARVSGVWQVDKEGKIVQAKAPKDLRIATPQSRPRMGDLVFMNGKVLVDAKNVIDPAADHFRVSWDHVAFFVVRSRDGRDFHLAKDGDENPTGMYHTGMKYPEGFAPGAYVRGQETLLMYLTLSAAGTKPAAPPTSKPALPDAGSRTPGANPFAPFLW
jgi:hypothetical protein